MTFVLGMISFLFAGEAAGQLFLQHSTPQSKDASDALRSFIRGQPDIAPDEFDDASVRTIYEDQSQVLSFGDGGRQALVDLMRASAQEAAEAGRPYVMMEIGVWLGASLAKWLQVHPNVYAIGIDPFEAPGPSHYFLKKVPSALKQHFGAPGFNRRLADYVVRQRVRDGDGRFAMVTGYSPQAAQPILNQSGVMVDLFYIDGGKIPDTDKFTQYIRESLEAFHSHNRAAILSGDDWDHADTPTLRPTLKAFAAQNRLQLAQSAGRTWLMAKDLEKRVGRIKGLTWEVRNPEDHRESYTYPPKTPILLEI